MTRTKFCLLLFLALGACGSVTPGAQELPDGVVISEDATPEERAAVLAAVAELQDEEAQEPPAPRRGVFAFLRPQTESADTANDVAQVATAIPDETVYEGEPETSGGGLFALLRGKRQIAPDTDQVVADAPEELGVSSETPDTSAVALSMPTAPGQMLPFGEVAEVCGLSRREMGKEVDTYPSDGRTMFKLYDTDPSSTGLRTQYIAGLKRGCALQVTASLVLFGSPAAHEIHRYGAGMKGVAYSNTDNTYEHLKSQICNVGRNQPCKGAGVDRMGRKVAFVSVYRQFGQPTGWLELLLADGRLASKNMR